MSEKIEDGGPAFPQNLPDDFVWRLPGDPGGMSLRDWFAGHAMAGYMALPDERRHTPSQGDVEEWRARLLKNDAEYCYQVADAMLKARKQCDT
jgi:hypothetical protein